MNYFNINFNDHWSIYEEIIDYIERIKTYSKPFTIFNEKEILKNNQIVEFDLEDCAVISDNIKNISSLIDLDLKLILKLHEFMKDKHNHLSIEFKNNNYESWDIRDINSEDFISIDEYLKALESKQYFTLYYYPNTPVGFYTYHASSFETLIEYFLNHN
jgi:hypothetical protein